MYPDIILPRAHPDLLSKTDYDPYQVMPGSIPPAPRVFATQAQFDRARERIARGVAVDKEGLKALLLATQIDEPLPPIKEATGPADWGMGAIAPPLNAAFYNAVAWKLTDDLRHHARALQALRLAASGCVDPRVKWTGLEHHEARLAGMAYDLLNSGPLSPEDNEAFRAMLYTLVAKQDLCPHRHCNNHNAMQMTGRLALGLALGDRQVIHDVLYGNQYEGKWRYGLIHLMRHDFLADGMHWEGVPGYHMLVLMMVMECFTQLQNAGVDLWHRNWPSTLKDEGFDEHNSWGPKCDKNLKAALDCLIFQAFSNGDYSQLHDQVLGNLRGTWVWWQIYLKAWDVFQEPRYAWVLSESNHGKPITADGPTPAYFAGERHRTDFIRFETRTVPVGPAPFNTDIQFAALGSNNSGCSLFPAHGSAILRAEPRKPDGLGAYLYWGPHCAGHRSPASLHLELHGLGRRASTAPHVYKDGYAEPMHLTWYRTTIAHNTVSIDGKSMFPYDFETDSLWEYELWRDSISNSRFHFLQHGLGFHAIRASNDNVYKDATLDRTVVLTPEYILDIFRVTSTTRRTFDWAMHLIGQLPGQPGETPINLGDERGYRHLQNPRLLPARTGPLTLDYTLADSPAHGCLWLAGDTQVILADDPAPDARKPIADAQLRANSTCLIQRASGKSALFLSAWSFGTATAKIIDAQTSAGGEITLRVSCGDTRQTWRAPLHGDTVSRET